MRGDSHLSETSLIDLGMMARWQLIVSRSSATGDVLAVIDALNATIAPAAVSARNCRITEFVARDSRRAREERDGSPAIFAL